MRRPAATAAALLGLAGCAGQSADVPDWMDGSAWDVARVARTELNPDPYLGALQAGYLDLAKFELGQYDWHDSALYLEKAAAAARGERFLPRDARERGLELSEDHPMTQGRAHLIAYLASPGAMLRAPRQIGEAQTWFDCWVEQLEEGHQADHIANCRDLFQATLQLVSDLAKLPDNMAVVLPKDGETGGVELVHQGGGTATLDSAFAAASVGDDVGALPVDEGEIRDAFAPALGARPPPPAVFEVYFDFNSTRISDDARNVIWKASTEAQRRSGAEVLISGYADAVGGRASNRAIAAARAASVERALAEDLPAEHDIEITRTGIGERDLAVATADAEEKNRRVVILVR